jgi:hypothetical protein
LNALFFRSIAFCIPTLICILKSQGQRKHLEETVTDPVDLNAALIRKSGGNTTTSQAQLLPAVSVPIKKIIIIHIYPSDRTA